MYSRKSVGPRMEPRGTLALAVYYCEDFLLLRKEEIKPKPACQTLSKALDILNATARLDPDWLKALPILSDATVRGCKVDLEDLKPHWKSEKRPHVSW